MFLRSGPAPLSAAKVMPAIDELFNMLVTRQILAMLFQEIKTLRFLARYHTSGCVKSKAL
jgi:hypothetical protein